MTEAARKLTWLTPAADRPSTETIGSLQNTVVRPLRATPRLPAKIPARLQSERWLQTVEVRNISLTGVGVRGAFDARPGDALTILLQDGRSLHAEVRWVRMGFCGLQFAVPLSIDDPLFEGQMVARAHAAPTGGTAEIIPVRSSASDQTPTLPVTPQSASTRPLGQPVSTQLRTLFLTTLRAMSQRRLERSCRKQGFAWLIDETVEDERR